MQEFQSDLLWKLAHRTDLPPDLAPLSRRTNSDSLWEKGTIGGHRPRQDSTNRHLGRRRARPETRCGKVEFRPRCSTSPERANRLTVKTLKDRESRKTPSSKLAEEA